MELIGMLDSPYVRRAAISAKLLGLPFEHRSVSVFRHFDEFRALNPVVKAPTLFTGDGTMLIDSSLIVDYLDRLVPADQRLLPEALPARTEALALIGLGLAASEKTVQVVYEYHRPEELRFHPWLQRVLAQLEAAYDALEERVSEHSVWLVGENITQADVTVAVAWRFTQFMHADCPLLQRIDAARYPALAAFSARAEALPEFVSTPLD